MRCLGVFGQVYVLTAFLLVPGLIVAYQFVQPALPDRLVMATGPDGGEPSPAAWTGP